MSRSYNDLLMRDTFVGRFRYLVLGGRVGDETFGYERALNQAFYMSREWKDARDVAIIRDGGCDLGIPGYEIHDKVFVHHMNPIEVTDLVHITPEAEQKLFDPDNLICASLRTHNAIHYGNESQLPEPFVERRPGDTTLWERQW